MSGMLAEDWEYSGRQPSPPAEYVVQVGAKRGSAGLFETMANGAASEGRGRRRCRCERLPRQKGDRFSGTEYVRQVPALL